jgi:hypothetical protein
MVERYPRNAKMLKAYARFLEDVQHDPWRANRYYVEADKHGSSDTSSNLAMLAKSVDGSLGIPGMEIDETNTGIIIINADGIVMALNHVRIARESGHIRSASGCFAMHICMGENAKLLCLSP